MAAQRNEVDSTLDGVTRRPRSVRKTFSKTFLTLFLIALVFVALLSIGTGVFDFAGRPQAISSIHNLIVGAKPWLILWRLGLFLVLVIFWSTWAQLLARRRDLSADQTAALLAARWKVAAWLIVIELVIVQAIPMKFIHAIANW